MEPEKIEEGAVVSPMQPEVDLNKYRDDTTVKAVTAIFKILGNNAEILSYDSKATKESIEAAEGKVTQEMTMAIIDNKVPEADMQILIETFQVVIHRLFEHIARMKREYEKEYLAMAFESRIPGDGHFSREYATLGDLFTALEKMRIAKKDDAYGYFTRKQTE